MDGFCLHYAIINSYKSLFQPNQTAYQFSINAEGKWKKIVANTPSLHHFASGEGSNFGISTDKLDIELKRIFVQTSFKLLTEKTNQEVTVEALNLEDIEEIDYSKSVVILCLKDSAVLGYGPMGDHWIALVDNDSKSKEFKVACSYTLHDHGYKEEKGPLCRYYNNSMPYSEVKKNRIWQNSIHLVTNKNA